MTSEITPTGSAASALRKIYKQIDALCIDAREAGAPADNVGVGVERVLAGEPPATVASELRAIARPDVALRDHPPSDRQAGGRSRRA